MPERCAHSRPCRQTSTPALDGYGCHIGCGTLARPSLLAHRPDTHNTTTSAVLTPSRRKNYVPASPGEYRQMEHTCMTIAPLRCTTSNGYWVWHPAPRSQTTHGNTATPTACESSPGSDNHDMSRLSAFAYPNDAPIHGLADIRIAYSQRILVWCPAPRSQTRHTQHHNFGYKLALSRPKNYLRAAPVDFCHNVCIRLAAAPSRPLFLADLDAAPSPLAPRPDPHD
jgi:hypothetical protein